MPTDLEAPELGTPSAKIESTNRGQTVAKVPLCNQIDGILFPRFQYGLGIDVVALAVGSSWLRGELPWKIAGCLNALMTTTRTREFPSPRGLWGNPGLFRMPIMRPGTGSACNCTNLK